MVYTWNQSRKSRGWFLFHSCQPLFFSKTSCFPCSGKKDPWKEWKWKCPPEKRSPLLPGSVGNSAPGHPNAAESSHLTGLYRSRCGWQRHRPRRLQRSLAARRVFLVVLSLSLLTLQDVHLLFVLFCFLCLFFGHGLGTIFSCSAFRCALVLFFAGVVITAALFSGTPCWLDRVHRQVVPDLDTKSKSVTSLGDTSPFFPGILLSRKPPELQGTQLVSEKNDG